MKPSSETRKDFSDPERSANEAATQGEPRNGDVVERIFDGRAVRHWPETERFHCMAYPCPNVTRWFYIPAWSRLCMECMVSREASQ